MNKNILLGITGGIAAYKMAETASRLTKADYNVNVVMTEAATKFISPLTFETITGNKVETELFKPSTPDQVKHISLAQNSDIIVIAPATADFISKMAGGLADDLLSTLILASEAPILISPSMNVNMYHNPVIQENMEYLQEKGVKFIEPDSGYLACGDIGKGRLPEPEILVEAVISILTPDLIQGKKVMVTAGPTREPLDPVRFISNYSSGKMGFNLAASAYRKGGEVTLITGPTSLTESFGVQKVEIETALELEKEIQKVFFEQDLIIMAAAVSDFRIESPQNKKIKKEYFQKELNLVSNPDILKELGEKKSGNQLLVGFAAETDHIEEYGQKKLEEKNLDLVVVNDVSRTDIGFGVDENEVTLITASDKKKIDKKPKSKIADEIIEYIAEKFME